MEGGRQRGPATGRKVRSGLKAGKEGRKAQLQAGRSAAGLEAKRPGLQARGCRQVGGADKGGSEARCKRGLQARGGGGKGCQRPGARGADRQGCRPCPWC